MFATGIIFFNLVQKNGWQMALELMKIKNHPSHIWSWPQSLQQFIVFEVINRDQFPWT